MSRGNSKLLPRNSYSQFLNSKAVRLVKRIKPKQIADILEELFPDPAPPLLHKDPYTLLVAVLLSAQCTDLRVNKITPLLFQIADTPSEMAIVSIEKIQDIIRPCGLSPQKARAISELSQILVEKYSGEVPRTFEALEALPGVGHKTASVVMSQAFGMPAFPVDTHIHRLAERWGLSTGKNVKQTEEDLKRVFPESSWKKLHLQMIYFGRKYCPARGHVAADCPICSRIAAKT